MAQTSSTVWLNGDYTDGASQIAVNDRGFLLGDGVFETLLVKNGAPVFLEAHLSRLSRGLELMRLPSPGLDEIGPVFQELAHLNGAEDREAVGRLTVTRGVGARGLVSSDAVGLIPTILATVDAAPTETKECVKLHLTERIRDVRSITSSFKSLSGYQENQAARFEATDAGCDEALLVNASGRIACAATANVFAVDQDGVVRTPPVSDGAMPGVVRSLLLESSGSHGIAIEETPIEPALLASASSIFLTNSLIGVQEACFENETSKPNEVVAKLADVYQIEIKKYLTKRHTIR